MYLKMLNVNRENALDVRKMYRNNETREKRRKTKKLLRCLTEIYLSRSLVDDGVGALEGRPRCLRMLCLAYSKYNIHLA